MLHLNAKDLGDAVGPGLEDTGHFGEEIALVEQLAVRRPFRARVLQEVVHGVDGAVAQLETAEARLIAGEQGAQRGGDRGLRVVGEERAEVVRR